jgi:hypothetical protein
MQSPSDSFRDRFFPVLCALVALLAVLASLPFVEAGFNDDWGYAYIALNLARTGHFSYGSLSAATLLFQAYWGSALIHLFGFSFQLLRFSTLPFAMGCAVLCYRLARLANLPPASSLFASLALVSSPAFIPLAASFMTDVYACFFMLLAYYCGACAGREGESLRGKILWLASSTLAGYVGGLNRQTVYAASGSVLLWAIWHWRRDRAVRSAAGFLLVALCLGAGLAVRWQWQQPLSVGFLIYETPSWRKAAIFPAQAILTLTLFILPAIVRFGKGRVRPLHYAISSAAVLAGFVIYWQVSHHLLFPWMVNLVSSIGILIQGNEMKGVHPEVLGHGVRIVITLAVLASLVRVGAVLLDSSRVREAVANFQRTPVLQILAILAIAYMGFLLMQSRIMVFDRYLMPMIPVALILALAVSKSAGKNSPGPENWAVLVVFALYGIAITHDYFASVKARVAAYGALQSQGIPAREICGGLELDGWTQAELAGRLYLPDPKIAATPANQEYWLLGFAPNITPRYYLSWTEEPGMKDAPIPPVSFRAWLPPFRREVRILVPVTQE